MNKLLLMIAVEHIDGFQFVDDSSIQQHIQVVRLRESFIGNSKQHLPVQLEASHPASLSQLVLIDPFVAKPP